MRVSVWRGSMEWPPSKEALRAVALTAFDRTDASHTRVLVYADNPDVLIMKPFCFAPTQYVNATFEYEGRTVEVVCGRED